MTARFTSAVVGDVRIVVHQLLLVMLFQMTFGRLSEAQRKEAVTMMHRAFAELKFMQFDDAEAEKKARLEIDQYVAEIIDQCFTAVDPAPIGRDHS